ncbi:MAG: transcriptional repressor [Clostridia bacterium]|nr:transcriptional repressor [Clostridia bacterium]
MTYHTKQRELLQAYLAEKAQTHLTMKEILEYARSVGIGTATVYRFMDKLTREGQLCKYGDAENGYCYQWHNASCNFYHFVCNDCGRLFHLNCKELDDMRAHFQTHHDFAVNLSKTIFCGQCSVCQGKENV